MTPFTPRQTDQGQGVPASPSGCQPTASAAEEASSLSGIPNACAKCGDASVRMVVEGEPLCAEHTMEWAHQETRLADEDRVCRVMRALDKIAEETPNGPWETHLRRMAEAAVDAM